jgi:hypothetical protein
MATTGSLCFSTTVGSDVSSSFLGEDTCPQRKSRLNCAR